MAASNQLLGLGILALSINIALMLIKIGAGLWGNSNALVADGIESASDIFSSLITWAGFQLSLKPADENHPYGHGKIESLAGMFAGLSLFGAASLIAYQSVLEIRAPQHSPEWFTLPVLVLVVAMKAFVSKRVFTAGDALGSSALKGDAWHHVSDAITSGAAAVGIAIALIGGPAYAMADDWAALAACGIIFVNGALIVRRSTHDVLDGTVDNALYEDIARQAKTVAGVENTEKCRIRKSGIDLFVELHVRVAPSMSVEAAHRISHEVKNHLMSWNAHIQDVTIHIEPA